VLSAFVDCALLFTPLFFPQLIASRDKIINADTNNAAAVLRITVLLLSDNLKFIYLILMPFCLYIPQYK